jgi:hypothetical protein
VLQAEGLFRTRFRNAQGLPQEIQKMSIQIKAMNRYIAIPDRAFPIQSSRKHQGELLKGLLEAPAFEKMDRIVMNQMIDQIRLGSRPSLGFKEGVGFQEGLAGETPWSLYGRKALQKVPPPSHEVEERIDRPAGVVKRIQAVCEAEPEVFFRNRQSPKNLGLRAGFPGTFVSVVYPVSKIQTPVPRGVEETTNALIPLIQIAQAPAAETGDGYNPVIFFFKGGRVLSQDPFDHVFVQPVVVPGRANGRAAGKAAFLSIRATQGDGRGIHTGSFELLRRAKYSLHFFGS